jgi:hypothetical protein
VTIFDVPWGDLELDHLRQFLARGELRKNADPSQLAKQTLAILQGGLILTQLRRNPNEMRAATDAALTLLRAATTPKATSRARSR